MENTWYTAEPETIKVSKKEFEEFIKNYPRELERHGSMICEPPAISYNDFELAAQWPYSVVAHTWAYSDVKGDRYYCPEEERDYFITVNHEELFASRINKKKENNK